MPHDVFISYSHEDRPWAEKLQRDLTRKGIDAFLDSANLRAGAQWKPALMDALKESRNLVVLWSNHAQMSSWVQNEVIRFTSMVEEEKTNGNRTWRAIIAINLEGENKVLSPVYHSIEDIKQQGAYPGGVARLDPRLWQMVLQKVEEGVRGAEQSIPIHLAIVAMTQRSLAQIVQNMRNVGMDSDALLATFGLGNDAHLRQCYGDAPGRWRPFGQADEISTLLEDMRDEVNRSLERAGHPSTRFRWAPVSEDFWSNDEAAFRRAVQLLATYPSVIIVDPLSLYDPDVSQRFNRLYPCFSNPKALILVLAPFVLPPALEHLRRVIETRASPVFSSFYEPQPLPGLSSAKFGPDVFHRLDVKRWLLTSVAPQMVAAMPQSQPQFLKM